MMSPEAATTAIKAERNDIGWHLRNRNRNRIADCAAHAHKRIRKKLYQFEYAARQSAGRLRAKRSGSIDGWFSAITLRFSLLRPIALRRIPWSQLFLLVE